MNTERNIIGQTVRVYDSFHQGPKTMLQVARQTSIERANICRYVSHLKDRGMIFPLRRGICPVSKCRATFYTTDSSKAWNYFIQETRTSWESLNNDDIVAVWSTIREYIENRFDGESIHVPGSISQVWRETIKPQIDREVMR